MFMLWKPKSFCYGCRKIRSIKYFDRGKLYCYDCAAKRKPFFETCERKFENWANDWLKEHYRGTSSPRLAAINLSETALTNKLSVR